MPRVYQPPKKDVEVYPSPALFGRKNNKVGDDPSADEGDQTNADDIPTTEPVVDAAALLAQKLASHAIHPMTSEELYDVRPPYNIQSWMPAHVERWVLFVIQLPQYAEKFREKGIDGNALLEITDDYLRESIGVDDDMQIDRFRRNIVQLQEQQKRILEDLDWAERYDKGLLVRKTVKLKKPKVSTAAEPATKADNALFFTGKHAAIYIIRNNNKAVENEGKELMDDDQDDAHERDNEESNNEEHDHDHEPLLITEGASSSGKLPSIMQQQQQPPRTPTSTPAPGNISPLSVLALCINPLRLYVSGLMERKACLIDRSLISPISLLTAP